MQAGTKSYKQTQTVTLCVCAYAIFNTKMSRNGGASYHQYVRLPVSPASRPMATLILLRPLRRIEAAPSRTARYARGLWSSGELTEKHVRYPVPAFPPGHAGVAQLGVVWGVSDKPALLSSPTAC